MIRNIKPEMVKRANEEYAKHGGGDRSNAGVNYRRPYSKTKAIASGLTCDKAYEKACKKVTDE